MSEKEGSIFYKLESLLQQDYRGVNIAVYSIATAGLAIAVNKIRPVSKFSKASKIPTNFIKNHEPLKGVYVGIQHSPVRLLINHKAPIYLPLWHSSKPPLPVKLWGVDIVSGNAVNWLDCVAKGQKVTLNPISRESDDLVSSVILHLNKPKTNAVENIDIGQKLIELGFAKASIPSGIKKNTLESKLAPALSSAEKQAKKSRNGIWSETLPPIPFYVIYLRKGVNTTKDLLLHSTNMLFDFVLFLLKIALRSMKNVALRPFRSNSKQLQTT
ncbi:unnamed protein product [Leptidea sinapis]|uniref:TNase-like domain-containing protein n=1 Tax=Leptidea sinapis TaxID=189913 RepID=A0A5E4QSP0_9NEOP|nr:unnamed protein product [Leptidea sinapis]